MAKFVPAPENASSLHPSEARALFRVNGYYGPTSGFCSGYTQANILVIPEHLADDFEKFCNVNCGPFPLLYRSKVGECSAPPLAKDSDVRTDIPRYIVYSNGKQVDDTLDLSGFELSWGNMVSFYLGCSFSFEAALSGNGIQLKNMEQGKNVSMYLSSISLKPVGPFSSLMYTSMRPIRKCQLSKAFLISSQFPEAHGAPIHMGNPARIGVQDISIPSAGDPSTFEEDEVPVFWACGFSISQIPMSVRPQLCFTHYSGSMFLTDIRNQQGSVPTDKADIVQLSRQDQPYFASVLETKSVNLLLKLEKCLLDDPGKRGVVHLYTKSDLVKSVLALSHASKVAITTGFPVHTHLDVKEETDGLPGALSICQGLLALGKEVVMISDSENQTLFESCIDHMVKEGSLNSSVQVLPCSRATEIWKAASSDTPPWDCLVAIERVGWGKDKIHRTMKAKPLSVDPVDDIFVMALSNPLVSTVAIGDGGNELGMGKVYDQVVKHIPLGETIANATPADFVIASGVSNWAGYALSLGLHVASSSPVHWRYRNHAIDANHPPSLNRADFVPTASQFSSLLKHMNDLGICDGISGKRDQSVDGLPLQVHLNKADELMNQLVQ